MVSSAHMMEPVLFPFCTMVFMGRTFQHIAQEKCTNSIWLHFIRNHESSLHYRCNEFLMKWEEYSVSVHCVCWVYILSWYAVAKYITHCFSCKTCNMCWRRINTLVKHPQKLLTDSMIMINSNAGMNDLILRLYLGYRYK